MTKHIAHHEHVAVFIFYTDSVHAQELGQKRVAMTFHYVLVVVGEVAVHIRNIFARHFLDDQSAVIGDKETAITAFSFAWGASSKGHQVIVIIDGKPISQVPEDLGTILLELEMTGKIFSMEKVIVDLDLGAGFKVIWQQHHWGRYLAELIDRVSDAPQEHAHQRVRGPEHLHFLLYEMLLLGFGGEAESRAETGLIL